MGRNLGQDYARMINSIVRQNYTNYRIVFVDDNSDDGTDDKLTKYLN